MTEATGGFENTSWDEQPFDERPEAGKLTRAAVGQRFTGDLTATATIQWLMAYRPDGTAEFVGIQRMAGTLGGREGTFVLESRGSFDGGVAKGTLTVITGSGTGGLAGLTGQGTFEAAKGPTGTYTLSYRLA
jgi:hypothetical protein